MLIASSFLIFLLNAITLPTGYEQAHWGMSVSELEKIAELHKASAGSEYQYADHMETNPDVYVSILPDKRVEYYFFQQKLYKIYLVYNKSFDTGTDSDAFYQALVQQHTDQYGKAHNTFQETVYGIKVQHNAWMNDDSVLDLRSGAGYVYQVRLDRKAAAAKTLLQQFRHSI